MRYAFPCDIVRDEEEQKATGRDAYVVTLPDISGSEYRRIVMARGFRYGLRLRGPCPELLC